MKNTMPTLKPRKQAKEREIYFMQAVALTNYAKLCNKLKEVPNLDVIHTLANSEDIKKLIKSNNLFISQFEQSAG
ncbi:hypothetical protein [Chryseobacterium indologenes]|uniref:Uncharacterized protein n=1 Tax=Chryseobacterium indologenes TaxID=253 RepID=A0A0N0ZWU7_CHRID|nr:hypothetical protein [Chryseobacterium indologenes]KPE51246.1 hypothetical protein AOB46_11310 [Chryseobacterium indologenes]